MPVLKPNYTPPWWLRNGHFQTVVGRYLRRPKLEPYRRRRIELADGDFLDLDEVSGGNERVAIVVHGLESCTEAPYVRSMAKALLEDDWDVIAVNLRGCSGEPNRLLRSYHSGATDELQAVVEDLRVRRPDCSISLIGFSLGGNIVLRFLGEQGEQASKANIALGIGISVPCELDSCAEKFAEPGNRVYMDRFLKLLFEKVRHRQVKFPKALDYEAILKSRNFHEFDRHFTAPINGFSSAQDYWTSCSAKATAGAIAVPTLLLNSADDPFLTSGCHLIEEADRHEFLHAELTTHGGHVAYLSGPGKAPYHEYRARQFMNAVLERAELSMPA